MGSANIRKMLRNSQKEALLNDFSGFRESSSKYSHNHFIKRWMNQLLPSPDKE
jgi:hypothetical protein